MQKEDFRIGQKVCLLCDSYHGNKKLEERIKEVEVVSVGRRYVTVNHSGAKIKFDITDNFREVTPYSPRYKIYPSREEIVREYQRLADEATVRGAFSERSGVLHKMSDEDLAAILAIIKKYTENG